MWVAQGAPGRMSGERGAMASGPSAPEAATLSGATTASWAAWANTQMRTAQAMSPVIKGPTPEHVALADKILSAATGTPITQFANVHGPTKIAHVEKLFGTSFSAIAAMPVSDINTLANQFYARRMQVLLAFAMQTFR